MQLFELRSLPGDPGGEVLQMTGNVGDFYAERAQAARELPDQAIPLGLRLRTSAAGLMHPRVAADRGRGHRALGRRGKA